MDELLEQESTTPLLEPVREDVPVRLLPWSALVCYILSAVSLLVTGVGLLFSESEHATQAEDRLSWHARNAMLLIIQSMVLEVCVLISSYTAVGIAGDDLKPLADEGKSEISSKKEQLVKRVNLAEHNFGDSLIIILEYIMKFLTAFHFMYPSQTIGYKVPLSPDPDRVVYPVRHLQWSLSVPLLVFLSNRAFLAGHCSEVRVLLRSIPTLFLSLVYCLTAFVMELTTSPILRNCLIGLTAMNFISVSFDQIVLAKSSPNVSAKSLKMAMLAFQVLNFSGYAVLYFLAYFGWMSCSLEQSLYTYMDATVKVFHGCFLAMIRNFEDIRVIRLWWKESVAARRDFERLVRQARVPIFTLDLEGRVTSWNASLAQITGLMPDSVEGTAITKLMKKDCGDSFRQAVARAASAVPVNCNAFEVMFRRHLSFDEDEKLAQESKGGKSKPESKQESCAVLVISIVKKLSRDGRIEGYVGIGQDITEIADLKAVEQKKVQLMALVSHELRSPLHGMIGLTNMMEQSTHEDRFKRQLGMVRCCANRLLDLVTNIMEMTESEQCQRKGFGTRDKKTVVNFLDVAEEVTVMTMAATDKAGKPLLSPDVEFKNYLPELKNFPVVLGNPYKCTQLLYNLMTNACKFTMRGSVTLRAKHVKDTSVLELYIEDTGSGISPEAIERIFHPFEQDHGSTADARSFQGMGLGLAVCKEVVDLHSGSVRVKSELGKGSTFIVSLPCEDHFIARSSEEDRLCQLVANERRSKALPSPEPEVSDCVPEEPQKKVRPPPGTQSEAKLPTSTEDLQAETVVDTRPLVLSVDDDAVNQEVVHCALSAECDIRAAMDGHQALEYLQGCFTQKTRLPDLILLDIQMPGMTGYEVLTDIRKNCSQAHTKLPVIMVSAKAPSEVAALKSYTDGCSDFLVKPFNTDLLKAKVSVALQVRHEASTIRRESAHIAFMHATAIEAAQRWEKEAKATQATHDQTQKSLEEAEERARAAKRVAAEAAEKAAGAVDRAAVMEQELAQLRKELEQSRLSSRTTASNLSPESCSCDAPTAAFTQMGSVFCPSAPQWMQSPRMHVPMAAAAGSSVASSQAIVPWLYEQLADREQEIARLSGRLAAETSTKDLASRQLEAVIRAAAHSKNLLDSAERMS